MSSGKRKGVGRPYADLQLVRVPIGLRLPQWLLTWLRSQDVSQSVLIEQALCRVHKLKPPVDSLNQLSLQAVLDPKTTR